MDEHLVPSKSIWKFYKTRGLTCQTITDEARLYLITQACLIHQYTFS